MSYQTMSPVLSPIDVYMQITPKASGRLPQLSSCNSIQSDLVSLLTWSVDWNLSFNHLKSIYMRFGSHDLNSPTP